MAKSTTTQQQTAQAKWPTVRPDDELTLVKLVVPYVRWIDQRVVSGISENNGRESKRIENILRAAGIKNPELYLWDGSACAYPGIRRKKGKHETAGSVGPQSLILDKSGNKWGRKAWELTAATASGFTRLRKGYELVHLFPHKAYEWKNLLSLLPDEVRNVISADTIELLLDHGLPGLFSNPANTCYLPAALVRPTDGNSLLRRVLWRQALELYGAKSLLPPALAGPIKGWLASEEDPEGLIWNKDSHHGHGVGLEILLEDRNKHFQKYTTTLSTQ